MRLKNDSMCFRGVLSICFCSPSFLHSLIVCVLSFEEYWLIWHFHSKGLCLVYSLWRSLYVCSLEVFSGECPSLCQTLRSVFLFHYDKKNPVIICHCSVDVQAFVCLPSFSFIYLFFQKCTKLLIWPFLMSAFSPMDLLFFWSLKIAYFLHWECSRQMTVTPTPQCHHQNIS